MNTIANPSASGATRRQFLNTSSKAMAGLALAAALPRAGYTAEDNTIQVAIVGCGGRGSGAVGDAMATKNLGPIKLVAMADVFENRLRSSHSGLSRNLRDQIEVPEDRRFIGFDAYKKAMDCLKPGDVVILTTPPAFRWVHFTYAIAKGLNVFMEKPVTVDGPSTRRMLKLAEDAKAKNLKVGVGLMSRHSRPLEELAKRIQDGEIGDVILQRGYRVHGPGGFVGPRQGTISELLYQIRRFHSFLWASGGLFSDFYIHIIDHLCWLKGAWPVKAMAFGGRHYRGDNVDQNFDAYSVEYTYADGSTMIFDGRHMVGCSEIYCSFVHGSKGVAVASKSGDCQPPSSIYKGQKVERENLLWESQGGGSPYRNEWQDLIHAIRNDQPYSEVKRGAEGSMVTAMGRVAAHTGQVITFEQMLNFPQELAPQVDQFAMDSPPPLVGDANGKYPVPNPGRNKDREF